MTKKGMNSSTLKMKTASWWIEKEIYFMMTAGYKLMKNSDGTTDRKNESNNRVLSRLKM